MATTKVTVIGAGSASFGLNTLGSILRSQKLRGSEIALVDRNPDSLALIAALAERLNREWDAQMTITSFTNHLDALPGTKFVVSAIEVPPRERLWKNDFELTLKYGVRQPYSENGGPGGFAHAARNILPVLQITQDMEAACPDAWFINFTNPMVRICDAINRYSKIQVVGLCHQIYAGYAQAGYLLADYLGINIPKDFVFSRHDHSYGEVRRLIVHRAKELLDIKAAGLNHFTWILDIRDRRTGQDLYPLLRENARKAPPNFEPLSTRVFNAFGVYPVPGDSHLDEYLPWCSDPQTKPWEKYDLYVYDWDGAERARGEGHAAIRRMGMGEEEIEKLKAADSEGALEVIECLAGAGNDYHLAVNRPNTGQISNLPLNTIVETPAVLSGMGVLPVNMGPIPDGVVELLRRELAVVHLCVDSVVEGNRQKALQCLLLDPVITDLDVAGQILDDYLATYKEFLPSFWK